MKKLNFTIREFNNFQKIATFIYTFSVSNGIIVVSADATLLEPLGY